MEKHSYKICKKCGQSKKLVRAHIIPECFHRNLYPESPKSSPIIKARNTHSIRSRIGFYDNNILCDDCEKNFQQLDDYGCKFFNEDLLNKKLLKNKHNIKIYCLPQYDYRKTKLFLLSILWRASISTKSFFNKVRLGVHENKIKSIIENDDAGSKDDYSIMINYIEESLRMTPNPQKIRIDGIAFYSLYFSTYEIAIKARMYPDIRTPAKSTVHAILAKHGLVNKQKKRRYKAKGTELSYAKKPNELWCADYKGEFLLGNRNYCYPLTITDFSSRYLLACEGLATTKEQYAFTVFERVFKEFGLPNAIRTDNGVPFSSPHALFGLSKLSVWWLRLGIEIERIKPGNPQ